jgi:superfamily II RNA helicase
LPVQKAKEEVEVITLTTIPHLSERGKAKRKKLFEESIKNYVWPTDSFTNPNTAVAAMTHEPVEEPEGHKPEWNTSNTCIEKMMPCAKWIQMLKGLDIYRNQIVHIEHIPSKPGKYRSVSDLKLPSRLVQALDTFGIKELYHHQYEAIQAALKGHNVVISTSTSSGKSLAYNIPVMHSLLENSNTNVFYLFPTKALAQDQLKSLRRFFSQAGGFPPNICSTFVSICNSLEMTK